MHLNLSHLYRFFLFTFLQVLLFNPLDFGNGIYIMVYPLYIMLLPFYLPISYLLTISFFLGFFIDIFSNTYGLHASAAVLFAYIRPLVFSSLAQRDNYDPLKEPSLFDMGHKWFLSAFSTCLFLHHFWFFILEIFTFSEFTKILSNTFLSVFVSLIFCLLISLLIVKRKKV